MLTGFLRPSSGSIRVKNFTIDKDTLEIKKLLGYLPESAPLYHHMIVYDYLDYVANIREIDRKSKLKRIRYLADLCGLNEVMHQPIGELSKGYKQRVGLAHAMMKDPEILVLDEPTSGLDPNQIVEIREIIRQIGKEKTVILSTHILSEAEATCDRVVIINRGKIIADGSLESLKQSATGKNRIHLSLQGADSESVEAVLGPVEGIEEISLKADNEDILHVKMIAGPSVDARGDIYRKIKETDWMLLEFYQETQTLENIFRELTTEN
jgi:ABC-2 type transport system ATP-binding protein